MFLVCFFCLFVYFSAPIADFYSLSYLWFSGLSVLTSFVVGIIMSLILGKFTLTIKYAHVFHSVPPYLNMSQNERCSQSIQEAGKPFLIRRYVTNFAQNLFSNISTAFINVAFSVLLLLLFYILTVKVMHLNRRMNNLYFKNSRHLFNQLQLATG